MIRKGIPADRLARVKQGQISAGSRRSAVADNPQQKHLDADVVFAIVVSLATSRAMLPVIVLIAIMIEEMVFGIFHVFDPNPMQSKNTAMHESCIKVATRSVNPHPMSWTNDDGHMTKMAETRTYLLRHLDICATTSCKDSGNSLAHRMREYLDNRIDTLNQAHANFGQRGIDFVTEFFSTEQDRRIVMTTKELIQDRKFSLTWLRGDLRGLMQLLIDHRNQNVPVCKP